MKIFEYCPSCKSSDITFDNFKQIKCSSCSFTYFHNVAAAAAAILEYDKKILFIRRAREPRKGKLDLPGGFIDPNESAEEGLNRELNEELGITLDDIHYLGSAQNTYEYKGITYNTCDLIFYYKLNEMPQKINEEIACLELKKLSEVNDSDFAFISTPKGLEFYANSKFYSSS